MKNPVNQTFTGLMIEFASYLAEEEGFEPPEV